MAKRIRSEGALALKPYDDHGTVRERAPRREYEPIRERYAEPERATARDYRAATHRFESRKQAPPPKRVKPQFKLKVKHVFVITLAFAAIFMLLYRQVKIEQQVFSLDAMRRELKEEQKRGEDLSLELSMRLDIEKVRDVAENELGMEYPVQGQVRAIVLPPIKNESTAAYAADTAPMPKENRVGQEGFAGVFEALMESLK